MSYISLHAFPGSSEKELLYFVRRMDIDRNGLISKEDYETYFDRLLYLT